MPGIDGTELIARDPRRRARGYTYIMMLSGAGRRGRVARGGAGRRRRRAVQAAGPGRARARADRRRADHARCTGGCASDARRDPLTGAGSRARLDEDLAALCARVVRYGHAYCVAMVGLEPGERRRDARGPAARSCARSAPATRSTATGPSEFVVLLPEQGLETANLAATRLRRAVENAVAPAGPRSASESSRPRAPSRSRRRCSSCAEARDAALRADRRRGGLRGAGAARCGCWSPTTTPCRG